MRIRTILGCSLLLATLPCFAGSHLRRGPTAQRISGRKSHKIAAHFAPKPVGQRAIDDTRAAQIQTALANAGYLPSTTSGHWDAETEAAMQKYQADNGWQTKLIPDSRAIIKLGLGANGAARASVDSRAISQAGSF